MVKEHNISLTINNKSGFTMKYVKDWYDSGRLADKHSWPSEIRDGDHCDNILNYERDWAMAGCSGYVQYKMGDTHVDIAFSNPAAGGNKLGVGLAAGDHEVWDKMTGHSYKPFVEKIVIGNVTLFFNCECSGGTTNTAKVTISKD